MRPSMRSVRRSDRARPSLRSSRFSPRHAVGSRPTGKTPTCARRHGRASFCSARSTRRCHRGGPSATRDSRSGLRRPRPWSFARQRFMATLGATLERVAPGEVAIALTVPRRAHPAARLFTRGGDRRHRRQRVRLRGADADGAGRRRAERGVQGQPARAGDGRALRRARRGWYARGARSPSAVPRWPPSATSATASYC